MSAPAMRRHAAVPLFLAAALFLGFAALVRAIDHDEGQYVGAVALMRHGLPFRDFMYLQTPLQPLLLAPLAWLGGGLFLSLRMVNALAAAGAVAIVFLGARTAGGSQRQAAAAAALMLFCEPLIFAGAVARNDAIPALFAATGTWLLLRSLNGAPRMVLVLLLAGLAFGAAISTKISYAVPAAAAGLMVLTWYRSIGPAGIAAFVAGGMAGVLPSLVMLAIAPEAWLFGVLEYGFTAPQQWWQPAGDPGKLGAGSQLLRFLRFLVQGPGLLALALVAFERIRKGGDRRALLLDVLIASAVIAALLPEPMFRQYLVPILPPLFMRLGSIPTALRARSGWTALLVISAVYGAWETARHASAALSAGSPVLIATRDAWWIGEELQRAGAEGPIVGLSPERLVDSGVEIDRRFVTGPFIFRTRGLLSAGEEEHMRVLTRDSFAAAFSNAPPAAIVTGGERSPSAAAPRGLDAPLDQWASSNGYEAKVTPSGKLRIYLRPAP